MQVPNHQRLARMPWRENMQKCKKMCFSRAKNPLFSCQNAQKTADFCCQYVFWRVAKCAFGLDGEQLTLILKTTLFSREKSEIPRRDPPWETTRASSLRIQDPKKEVFDRSRSVWPAVFEFMTGKSVFFENCVRCSPSRPQAAWTAP